MRRTFDLPLANHLDAPASKRFYNEQLFTEIAPQYDFVTRALSFGCDAAWKRHLVAMLPDAPAPACLDLACGTGDLTFMVAARYPAGRATGLDLTEPMLEIARRRCAQPNVVFRRGDMAALDWPDASADIVTGGYALRNAPSLEGMLAEIARVLRPGGVAAFLDFSKPPSPTFQAVEHFALKTWGGFWGTALHRNREVYAYIAESLQRYPDRQQFEAMAEAAGFHRRHRRLFFFGMLEVLLLGRDG